jgi:hypothetical protein
MQDSQLVSQILSEFYQQQAFPEDATVSKWFWVSYGPITVPYPNPKIRRDLIKYHDLTHLLTGYKTTWTGEGEIAAWELASGFTRKHWAGYLYSPLTLTVGFFIAPFKVIRAFKSGFKQNNIYHLQKNMNDIEAMTWGELKASIAAV